MKQKFFLPKIKLLLVLAIAILLGQNVFADNVVGYDLTSNANSTIGQEGTFLVSSSLSAPAFDPDNGAYSSGWATANQYWTVSPFNTTGLHTITVGAMMATDDAGPRDFQLQYKLPGGSWTNVGNAISLTGKSTAFNRTLPDECANVTGLEVRWINSSSTPLSGGSIDNEAASYIKAISILGSLPTYPNTQYSNITFTSITSTTIKIDGTIGNGDHRIIYIVKNTTGETEPTFPDPSDDETFVANPDYSTGNPTGYQVIYNGTGSSVTVTVPSSTNEYWFRVYEYNLNGTMPRYYTPTANTNPYLCSLPVIVTDPATLVRLTTATIGATITSSRYTVTARGTQIRTGSPLGSSTTNKVSAGSGDGSFTRNLTNQTRGSLFYYRGYATNSSGTIYADELTYDNIPEFSGSGNWEDNTKWDVQQVPGSTGEGGYGNVADSPIINGTCTLTASNSVTNLTINSGKSFAISTATALTVNGTITNNAGTNGLTLKSAAETSNGSLLFGNPGSNPNVPASVEMYSKSYWDTQYHWQYFGIPVQSTTVGATFTTSGNRVRQYNESNYDPTGNDIGLWLPSGAGNSMSSGTALEPVVGYEVVRPSAGTYTFKGNLNTSDVTNYALGYTSGADWQGYNIIANPFAGAINISSITSSNTDGAVYLYNSGSREEWDTNSGISVDGESPGQYTASNGEFAGNLGTPTQIPSMQGFLVKATAPGATISLPYSSVIANAKPQRVKQTNTTAITGTRIDVLGTKYADKMWIFTSDNCSKGFDLGYDATKFLGSASTPQIYATEEAGDFQINAVDNMNNTLLGFMPGSETNLKLKFTHQNIDSKYSRVYLVDLVENQTIDITQSGSEYSFVSTPTSTPTTRFKIVTTPLTVTAENSIINNSKFKMFSANNNLQIENATGKTGIVNIYSTSGLLIKTNNIESNKLTTISNLTSGAYIVKATIDNEKYIEKIIIR